jgi:ABC-2 type transport system permease protein
MAGKRALPGICWALMLANIRGEMQFRANFISEVAFGLVNQAIGFTFIWVVLSRFDAISGWTLPEVTLLYGIQLMGYALWTTAFSRIIILEPLVREGDFDTMLIRPVPIALQFMFGGVRVAIVGDILGAVLILAAGMRSVDIAWSPAKIAFLILAVIASGLIRGALELIACSLVFRTMSAGYLQWMTQVLFSQFGGYPLSIFTSRVRELLTWVVPVAFVAWVPASVLLGRANELPFPEWIAWCTPLFGVVLMTVAWWLFLRESKQYQSTGS